MVVIPGGKPKGLKGLPKRVTNTRKQALRQECWRRGEQRKDQRRRLQKKREEANKTRRLQLLPTPWQEARAGRRAARAHLTKTRSA